MFNKKGIGPVVATSLLIVVAVVGIVTFQTWFSTYSSNLYTDIETTSSSSNFNIERVIGDTLYFDNNKDNTTVDKIEVNGVDCNLDGDYNNSMHSLDLSSCLDSSQNGKPAEVVVFTQEGIVAYEFLAEVSSGPQYPPGAFVTRWDTTQPGSSNSNQITLPLYGEVLGQTGVYNFTVDWGDNTTDTITSWNQAETTHTYSQEGNYTVIIEGEIKGFAFWDFDSNFGDYYSEQDAEKFLDVLQWGDVVLGNTGYFFAVAKNLESFSAQDTPNLNETINLRGTFLGANSFNGDISDWDVSNVVSIREMFKSGTPWTDNNLSSFNQPLNSWNTSSIVSMYGVFDGANDFNQPLDNWDTSSVTSMFYMFKSASDFNQDISSWDVSNVETNGFYEMFNGASSFNQPLNSWNVSKATDIRGMFSGATNFNQDLNSWDVSNVETIGLRSVFSGATNFNGNISDWNISKVTSLEHTFSGAESFNQDISDWDTSSIVSLRYTFGSAESFDQDISGWDTSSLTNMDRTFNSAISFNQNISGWNVSLVTDMSATFNNASNFNQDLSSWDVDQVGTTCTNFNQSTPSWALSKPNLDPSCLS